MRSYCTGGQVGLAVRLEILPDPGQEHQVKTGGGGDSENTADPPGGNDMTVERR
jgi:hypothetical protein